MVMFLGPRQKGSIRLKNKTHRKTNKLWTHEGLPAFPPLPVIILLPSNRIAAWGTLVRDLRLPLHVMVIALATDAVADKHHPGRRCKLRILTDQAQLTDFWQRRTWNLKRIDFSNLLSFSKFIDCSRQWPQFAYIVMVFITIVAALWARISWHYRHSQCGSASIL